MREAEGQVRWDTYVGWCISLLYRACGGTVRAGRRVISAGRGRTAQRTLRGRRRRAPAAQAAAVHTCRLASRQPREPPLTGTPSDIR